jgi:hypothetical protein
MVEVASDEAFARVVARGDVEVSAATVNPHAFADSSPPKRRRPFAHGLALAKVPLAASRQTRNRVQRTATELPRSLHVIARLAKIDVANNAPCSIGKG